MTPALITIKLSKPGLIVRDPSSKLPIGSEPLVVERTSYWLRRVQDGSVVLVTQGKSEAPKPANQNAKKE